MRVLLRVAKIGLAWLLFAAGPAIALALGFFGGARIAPRLAAFVGLALAACGLAAYGAARLALVAIGKPRRPRLAAALAAAYVGVAACAGWAALFRRASPIAAARVHRTTAFQRVTLPTGSTVAFVRIPAAARAAASPLIFLHGGPGGSVRESDLDLLRAIAERGVDVVAYDQAGGGESDRLDVREYTVARVVADLDALRAHLGAEKISLLGQSWGSMLAYAYVAAHPERVDRVVVTSAGIRGKDTQFVLTHTAATRQPSFPPFFFVTMALVQVNPDAALAFASREEIDHAGRVGAGGNIARWYCKEDAAKVPPDPLSVLPALDVYQGMALRGGTVVQGAPLPASVAPPPTLFVRGACDFIPWSRALLLRDRMNATVVALPDVGHSIWPKRQQAMVELAAAHLRGAPLPAQPHVGDEDPAVKLR